MFEAAELGRKLSKQEFTEQLPALRAALLRSQQALKEKGVSVVVVIAGLDGAGKAEVVNRLNEWLDPRGIDTHTFWEPSDEERERPPWWRHWRVLPSRGRIAILFGGWYSELLPRRAYGEIKNKTLDRELDRIAAFEQMLAADGVLVVKLWFHLSKKDQRKRLKQLEKSSPTHWRLLPRDWEHYKRYAKFVKAAERIVRRTNTGPCPWHLVEAMEERYRDLSAGQVLLSSFQQALTNHAPGPLSPPPAPATPAPPKPLSRTILDQVDLGGRLSETAYREALRRFQRRLNRLVWAAHDQKRSTVLLFEGWDAAGKGSAIRRLTEAMDARLYRIIPIAAPTDEEKAHHYLWRFWRHLPRLGCVTIFDRSWYGRVLVERVEGFAREAEWRRAYHEINDFEEQLVEHGMVLLKFWIHISKGEQLRRFKERARVSYKRHKITPEDWRNRKQWSAYEGAVNDMVAATSTAFAPWTLVAGNDKKFARIQILRTVCERLEETL